MEKKPNVFPNKEQQNISNEKNKQENFEQEKLNAITEVYLAPSLSSDTPSEHLNAVEAMRRRTEEQLRLKNSVGVVQDQSLSENSSRVVVNNQMEDIRIKTEDQMRLRDEILTKNASMIQNYQKQFEEASTIKNNVQNTNQNMSQNFQPSSPTQPAKQEPISYGSIPSSIDKHIYELSQPNFNSPFDVIPLPSEGKVYRSKKNNIKVSFMTTADENILTSPNLLKSGDFLSILINRKILEPELRYENLHLGDRNAIMIWLRATGYGEMYPVTLLDENNTPFETQINLNELKYKKLGAEPDEEGYFDFIFPLCKAKIKFKLLTCGDVDEIEKRLDLDKEANIPVNNTNTYFFEKTIIEINGNRDKNVIKEFINNLRIRDSKELKEYIEKIESGIDLNIEVRTPGGGSIATFLPLNENFFWPDFGL